jgi:hypothetical protein
LRIGSVSPWSGPAWPTPAAARGQAAYPRKTAARASQPRK